MASAVANHARDWQGQEIARGLGIEQQAHVQRGQVGVLVPGPCEELDRFKVRPAVQQWNELPATPGNPPR